MALAHDPHLATPWKGEEQRGGWGAGVPATLTLLLPLPGGGRVGVSPITGAAS